MLHKWIEILKTSDVEPGEAVREGEDPHAENGKEAIVREATETAIVLTDGTRIPKSGLSSGRYWHKFKQSAW